MQNNDDWLSAWHAAQAQCGLQRLQGQSSKKSALSLSETLPATAAAAGEADVRPGRAGAGPGGLRKSAEAAEPAEAPSESESETETSDIAAASGERRGARRAGQRAGGPRAGPARRPARPARHCGLSRA